MIFVLGEILFDIYPDEKRLGGAPFNFAFHLKSLGFDVRFVSRVGRDDLGGQILEFLEKNSFDTRDIQQDPDHATGTVLVSMHPDGGHDFSIVVNTAYDHIAYDKRLRQLCRSDWKLFYVGSLIQRTKSNAALVQEILIHKPRHSISFCDINLRPGCYSHDSIHACLNLADMIKVNQEELDEISNEKNDDMSINEKVRQLMTEYSLGHVILTKGDKGSQWFLPNTNLKSQIPENTGVIQDTVGAGDAYAAMAVAGQMNGLSLKDIINLAEEFAGFICRIKGAVPKDNSIYREFKRRLKQ